MTDYENQMAILRGKEDMLNMKAQKVEEMIEKHMVCVPTPRL